MQTKKLSFPNRKGELLSAKLNLPINREAIAFAIFAHCFTCNKNLNAIKNISRSLSNDGIAVLSFDFTGLGESDGEFDQSNFSSNISDIIDAYEFLAKNYSAPEFLIGHSLGGAAVLHAAAELPRLKAVATIGAPAEALHVKSHFHGKLDEIKEIGLVKVSIGGRPFNISNQFVEDLERSDTAKVIEQIRIPLMIMHAPFDKIVGIENAAKIYKAARHPKNFISLDNADHLLSDKSEAYYAGKIIAAWFSKYIDESEKTALETDLQVICRIGKSFTTEIQSGIHHLTADEPVDVGGNNYGPSPYEFLLSALGACSAMTLRMYADRKKWDLKEVNIHLQHGKDYVSDSQHAGEAQSKIDKIKKVIELEGDLDEEQRKRLLEIAGRCPVHQTLTGQIQIDSFLK